MRKQVRDIGPSNETWGIAKSIFFRLSSVKKCVATPTVPMLHTQGGS